MFYFVYLFADGCIYWFETAPLIEYLEANLNRYKSRTIYNKGWTALGYLVPRSDLEPLIKKKEFLFERESA